jgi:hypothetical protein
LIEPFTDSKVVSRLGKDDVRIQGVPAVQPGSQLAADDDRLNGFWESIPATIAMGGALDAILGLRDILSADTVTSASPWTLTRQAIESSSTALWILGPASRDHRMERTLRYWRDDIEEWEKWRIQAGKPKPTPAAHDGQPLDMTTPARLGRLRDTANGLGLRPAQIAAKFSLHDVVADAASAAGLVRNDATATWRAASGFAHSRMWPLMVLHNVYAGPTHATGARSAVTTFDESEHSRSVSVLEAIMRRAVGRYAELATA